MHARRCSSRARTLVRRGALAVDVPTALLLVVLINVIRLPLVLGGSEELSIARLPVQTIRDLAADEGLRGRYTPYLVLADVAPGASYRIERPDVVEPEAVSPVLLRVLADAGTIVVARGTLSGPTRAMSSTDGAAIVRTGEWRGRRFEVLLGPGPVTEIVVRIDGDDVRFIDRALLDPPGGP